MTLVTVLVGSTETRFDLHRGILCASSDFFKAAITSDFKERAQSEIKLPEQDVKIFRFFVHWLYTGRLSGFYYPKTMRPTIQELKEAVIAELENQDLDILEDLDPNNPYSKALYMAIYRDAPFSHLIRLYILADTLLVRDLKDPIIALIIEVYCWPKPTEVVHYEDGAQGTQQEGKDADEVEASISKPGINDIGSYSTIFWNLGRPPGLEDPCQGINIAWEALPRNSPLCRLLVECFCSNILAVEEHTNGRQYHPGFLAAVAQGFALRLCSLGRYFWAPDWDKFREDSEASEWPFAKRATLMRRSHKSD